MPPSSLRRAGATSESLAAEVPVARRNTVTGKNFNLKCPGTSSSTSEEISIDGINDINGAINGH